MTDSERIICTIVSCSTRDSIWVNKFRSKGWQDHKLMKSRSLIRVIKSPMIRHGVFCRSEREHKMSD